jgi:hypothetical protein
MLALNADCILPTFTSLQRRCVLLIDWLISSSNGEIMLTLALFSLLTSHLDSMAAVDHGELR